MKKIRIDYYHYRLRKGQASVLLQRVEAPKGAYCIPFHYVRKEDSINDWYDRGHVYDDGDFVFCVPYLNEDHVNTESREWVPLEKVRTLTILRDESLFISKCIFTFFLHLCPQEGESGNRRKAVGTLEEIKIDRAKLKYKKWLQNLLEENAENTRAVELIQEEIWTLKYFRPHYPPFLPMNLRDSMLEEQDEYDFERPDLLRGRSIFTAGTVPGEIALETTENR